MSGNPSPTSLLSQPLHSPAPKFNLIVTLEKELQDVPEDAINTLSRKIYPVETLTSNFYNSLYRSLLNYFMIQSNKGYQYETIVGDVIGFSSHINHLLMAKIAQILKTEDVKNRLLESSLKINNLSMTKNLQNANKKTPSSSLLDNLSNKYSKESSNKYGHLLDGGFRRENNNNLTIENQDVGASTAEKYIKDKSNVQNLIDRITFEKQLTKAGKIGNKKCLVCDSLVVLNELNRNQLSKDTFKCFDCGEIFHKKCMQRQNNCFFCQLSNINPLQKTRTPLFLGILKKGTKRHELQFELSKFHLQSQLSQFSQKQTNDQSAIPTIELRSIRMKDAIDPVSNFINLFPDACSLMINTKLIREFEPLHKQSSLKYRRDECMKISSNLNIGSNKIVITERINKKDMKPDQRIQLENHLVGVYIVQSLQIPRSTDYPYQKFSRFLKVIGSTLSQFEQSESLLKQSLFIRDKNSLCRIEDDQQLVCDSIKVPLICSLTLQKMKFPGRTIFCKHFNCFDVENFILLNAQAKLPKWQCPICKASAYKFQIDCALSSIVSQLDKLTKQNIQQKNFKIKDNEKVAQVEVNRKFQITLLNAQGYILISKGLNKVKNPKVSYLETQFVPFWIKGIYDLPIAGKSKRERQENEEISIENKFNESVSAMSLVDQKPMQKYNQQQIQRVVESVQKSNTNPFIISIHKSEDKKPKPFQVRIENYKQKQNSPMKDENQPIEQQRDINKNDSSKNKQCIDNVMLDDESFEQNQQIRKLQFYDSSENSMRYAEEKPRQEIENQSNEQQKLVEISENKAMEQCEQIQEKVQKNPQSFSPQQQQKSDAHEEDEEMQKAFAQYQQNCYDKMKRVLQSGAEVPKVINPQVIQNMNESLQKELQQKQNNQYQVSNIFKCSQPQSQYSIQGAKFNASYHSEGNDFGEQFQEELSVVNKISEEQKAELKEPVSGQYLYKDSKFIYADQSKSKQVSDFSKGNNAVIDKDNKFSAEFRQSQKQEIEGNSSSQVQKPIASQPQTFQKKKITQKQKQKFDKILNNGFTSEKPNTSKNDSKMITRKRAKNAVLPNSKAKQREKADKDRFTVPDDADVIELSD